MNQIGSNCSSEDGNPSSSSVRVNPAKRWCFTLNNYTDEDISSIVPIIRYECTKAIIGKEVGENGTPHLQGFFIFKSKKRPMGVFNNHRIHFELARCNDKINYDYCYKENEVILLIGFLPKPTTINRSSFYAWQEEMVRILEVPPKWDCRTIYWRWGAYNIGKTQFSKWCCMHLGAVIIGGYSKHMLAQVQRQPAHIYIILLSNGEFNLSYRALEKIKDGLFTSNFGCDNNQMEIRNAPHILVIGNSPPDMHNVCFHNGKYDVKEI